MSALGKAQHVHGADEAGLDRLDGVVPATWMYIHVGCFTDSLTLQEGRNTQLYAGDGLTRMLTVANAKEDCEAPCTVSAGELHLYLGHKTLHACCCAQWVPATHGLAQSTG